MSHDGYSVYILKLIKKYTNKERYLLYCKVNLASLFVFLFTFSGTYQALFSIQTSYKTLLAKIIMMLHTFSFFKKYSDVQYCISFSCTTLGFGIYIHYELITVSLVTICQLCHTKLL